MPEPLDLDAPEPLDLDALEANLLAERIHPRTVEEVIALIAALRATRALRDSARSLQFELMLARSDAKNHTERVRKMLLGEYCGQKCSRWDNGYDGHEFCLASPGHVGEHDCGCY